MNQEENSRNVTSSYDWFHMGFAESQLWLGLDPKGGERSMRDVNLWLKKIQESESFAQKYKGLDNVRSIIKQARKDGYNINKEDLKNTNLKKIAGGNVTIIDNKIVMSTQAIGDDSRAISKPQITIINKV